MHLDIYSSVKSLKMIIGCVSETVALNFELEMDALGRTCAFKNPLMHV